MGTEYENLLWSPGCPQRGRKQTDCRGCSAVAHPASLISLQNKHWWSGIRDGVPQPEEDGREGEE